MTLAHIDPFVARIGRTAPAACSLRQGYAFGAADAAVAGDERDAVDDARGGDELVRRIGTEVEARGCAADLEVNRPDMNPVERVQQTRRIQAQRNAAELRQLGDLPQHDRRDAP